MAPHRRKKKAKVENLDEFKVMHGRRRSTPAEKKHTLSEWRFARRCPRRIPTRRLVTSAPFSFLTRSTLCFLITCCLFLHYTIVLYVQLRLSVSFRILCFYSTTFSTSCFIFVCASSTSNCTWIEVITNTFNQLCELVHLLLLPPPPLLELHFHFKHHNSTHLTHRNHHYHPLQQTGRLRFNLVSPVVEEEVHPHHQLYNLD